MLERHGKFFPPSFNVMDEDVVDPSEKDGLVDVTGFRMLDHDLPRCPALGEQTLSDCHLLDDVSCFVEVQSDAMQVTSVACLVPLGTGYLVLVSLELKPTRIFFALAFFPFAGPSLVHEDKLGCDVVEDIGLCNVTDKLLETRCQPSRVFRMGNVRFGDTGLCEHFLEGVLGDRLAVQTLKLLNSIGQRERVVLLDCSVSPTTKVLKVRLADAGEASSLLMAIVSALDNVPNNIVVDA